ncbi:NDT80/PhoG like DNA-binding family protein [Xylariales sp. AK1849]|nr:NDT80/PhoG like DNA-binding family protein [Xylariales sp. AK1849]
MAQGHRGALPVPYSTRNIYSQGTPLFTRTDHTQRSPPFSGPVRRHPLSPTPSPNIGFPPSLNSIRMETNQYAGKGQANIPPLLTIVTLGQLVYAQGHVPLKVDIQGTIDKGFFLSEGEWTCYRRNYFSCICSYGLTPHYPGLAMQYTPNGSGTTYDAYGFAMTISAVVAESDTHAIDLVQHTPKRDKGPVSRPERVQLSPKQPPQTSHPLGHIYTDPHRLGGGGPAGGMYGEYPQPQGGHPTEHTFERIQFKQATANNGKRRAAQQYYHLLIELYAHVGEIGRGAPEQWMKIAHRKSAKMIVRGRSPGHYQAERRGSTSSGPGGSSGTLGSYSGTQVPDYATGSSMLGSSYGGSGYDPRSSHHYGSSRHHDLQMEPAMSAEEVKAIDNTKEYQYYPTPIYEGAADPRQGIEMFSHRNDQDTIMPSIPGNVDMSASRLKHEHEGTLPSLFYPGTAYYPRACSRFEGKSTSAGYYPTMLPQSS